MNKGTVISCKEQNSKFGGREKICDVEIEPAPGQVETVRIYAKSQSKAGKEILSYSKIRQGVVVELIPRNTGTGFFIQNVIGEAPAHPPAQPGNGQAPAPARRAGSPTPEEIGQYIDNKAGHVARAYASLKQHFAAVGEEFTPEIFNSTISTVIISLDKHFGNDASAWGDPRPLLVAGSPEWEQTVAAIQKHGAGTVDKVIAKARVSPTDEEYLRYIENQAIN